MPHRSRLVPGTLHASLVVIAALLAAPRAAAQDEDDWVPPTISIAPPAGTFASASRSVTVSWGDNVGLDGASRTLLLNGQDVTASFTYTGTATSATSAAMLTLQSGSNTFLASICDIHQNCSEATAAWTLSPATISVDVTPDGGAGTVGANSSPAQLFTVRNTGNDSATFLLAPTSCTGSVSGCTASAASIRLAGGASGIVRVRYSVGAQNTSGQVGLRAQWSLNTVVSDVGTAQVTVGLAAGTPRAPAAALSPRTSSPALERDMCVALAAGAGAASECGDLRLSHSLPSIRTLNRARTPVLLYNSQHASPQPLVAAHVTLPVDASIPDWVEAVLTMPNGLQVRAQWPGAEWTPGAERGITVTGPELQNLATGLYDFTLQVATLYGSTRLTSPAYGGRMAVVNRGASAFGAGWWLAGLESLVYVSARQSYLWIGGDGSTREYLPVAGSTGTWAAPAIDRPDTLKTVSGVVTRFLADGARVQFDALGRHTATVTRLGHRTAFEYDAAGRLARVIAPVPLGSIASPRYTFNYGGTGVLTSIVAPGVRTVTVGSSGARISSITDPDGQITRFTYDLGGFPNLVSSRTGRGGTTTLFSYDPGRKVAQFRVLMAGTQANPAEDLVSTFESLEGKGIAASYAVADAYTRVDGPRHTADARDETLFWLDRFAAPVRIRDALGSETTLTRGDARFPALVTSIVDPMGAQTTATYDARGNVVSTSDLATSRVVNGVLKNATTAYEWHPQWNAATRVTRPEGEVSQVGYDAATGNRLWQEDGRGASSRVVFAYDTDGRVRSVTPPAVGGVAVPQVLEYEPLFGNVSASVAPGGARTEYAYDNVGRIIALSGPGDARSDTYYDAMGRDTLAISLGDATEGNLEVRKSYDADGNVLSLSRRSSVDVRGIGTVTTRWGYDRAGRKVSETAPDAQEDRYTFDPAGNLVSHLNRRGQTIRMRYDALNRLTARILPEVIYPSSTVGIYTFPRIPNSGSSYRVPGDSVSFTYDARGSILTADNRDARIRRRYHLNGTLRADTTLIRTYADLTAGGSFTAHVYGQEFEYDLNGRRVSHKYPANLVSPNGVPAAANHTARFAYDPQTGLLSTVTDILGNTFTYVFDARARLQELRFPGAIVDTRTYDQEDQLVGRRIVANGNASLPAALRFASPTLMDETYVYDARGRIAWTGDRAFERDTFTYVYSRLGSLVHSENSWWYQDHVGDHRRIDRAWWVLDAMGNIINSNGCGNEICGMEGSSDRFYYTAGTGRLSYQEAVRSYLPKTTPTYDGSGNIVAKAFVDENGSKVLRSASFYSAENRLYAFDGQGNASTSDVTAAYPYYFEEYRYDALGRRVLVRRRTAATGSCSNTSVQCHAAISRFVWDGDNILVETKMPGGPTLSAADLEREVEPGEATPYFGRVAYTPGGTIDQPLNAIRFGLRTVGGFTAPSPVAYMLHYDRQGAVTLHSYVSGAANLCAQDAAGAYTTDCVKAGYVRDRHVYKKTAQQAWSWFGSLPMQQKDGSGQVYMRNRYYDPGTNRFTQEDPSGLGGGLNTYGFAGGDPANYSDPFGLKPCSILPWRSDFCTWADLRENFSEWWHMDDGRMASEMGRGFRLFAEEGGPSLFKGTALALGFSARASAIVIPGPRNSPYGKVDYLLGRVPNSQESAGKGGFFAGVLGFDQRTMAPALRNHVVNNQASATLSAAGRVEIVGPMVGANGRTANVKTVWQFTETGALSFITAMPH